MTLFKKQKNDTEPDKSKKQINKSVTVNETLGSVSSSFKPPFASTPLDKLGLGMLTDPEEMFSVINNSDVNNDKKEEEEKKFYQKLMEEVGEIAKKIDEKKFDHLEDPIKTELSHVNQILNVSVSQDSEKQVLEESIQSNNFWKDHNKTIPSTPIIDPVKQEKHQSLETPNVILTQNHSRTLFSEQIEHNETLILFNSSNDFPSTPIDFFNESQPLNFDISFGHSPLFSESNEDPLNFLTPINTEKPKFAVKPRIYQDTPDSMFKEKFVDDGFGDLSLNEDELKIDDQDKMDYSFSEFQSPPEVLERVSSTNFTFYYLALFELFLGF